MDQSVDRGMLGEQQFKTNSDIPDVTLAWLLGQLQGRNRSRLNGRDLLAFMDRDLGEMVELDGHSPRRHLAKLNFVRASCYLVAGLAHGLEQAHQRGVLHGDIKPANILLTQSGRAMLMDLNGAAGAGDCQNQGMLVAGTPAYMAPEQLATMTTQVAAERPMIDPRSNIYSLGIVLYELLSGSSPFVLPDDAESSHASTHQLLSAKSRLPRPIPRSVIHISPGLDSILEKCLAPEPSERYQSAGELAEDLERYVDYRPLRHAPDPSWGERVGKWLRRHPRCIAVPIAALILAAFSAIGEVWFEFRYLHQADRLIIESFDRNSHGDSVGAYQKARQAELLVGKGSRLLPLLGFPTRHVSMAASVRMLNGWLSDAPYRKLSFYSALARSGQSIHASSQNGTTDSSALQALLAYQVLELPDWQQLPRFQSLDPESQADVLAFVTEMIVIQAADQLSGTHSQADFTSGRQTITELLARVPDAHKARYAVREVERLATGQSESPHDDALPPEARWETFDLYLMGVLVAKVGQFESAIRYFDLVLNRAAEEDTVTRYWAHFYRGYCAEQRDDFESAFKDYAICVDLDNQFAAHYRLGLICARQGKVELAAKSLREAARGRGSSILSLQVNLSAVELKIGNLPQALDAANDAVRLDERSADAYAQRGTAHAAMGHREQAIADLQRALDLDPACESARQNLALLQEQP